jgi:hypothetical protein
VNKQQGENQMKLGVADYGLNVVISASWGKET